MKKSILLIIFSFTVLSVCFPFQDTFAQTKWQCGNGIVRLGERYKSVLSKCGDPDDAYFYQSELGLRLGTKLTYHEKKMVILTFQNEFLQNIKQTSVVDSPVFLYFDRWGICTKIQKVGNGRR